MTTAIQVAKDYTVEEIDGFLQNISNIILYGKRTDKQKAFARADEWLDMRLALTQHTEGGE